VRRSLGTTLVIAGAALLVIAGAVQARGSVLRAKTRAAWAEKEAQSATVAARETSTGGISHDVARGAPVLRLVIPSIQLDEVVVEGVGERELLAGPGHLPGSPLPGDVGNAIISAHRDRHFHALGKIAVGATIETQSPGATRTWQVTRIDTVGARVPALFATRTPTLTLTTCWPIRLLGSAPDRLIVTAVPVRDARSRASPDTSGRARTS
jgi:sortase A